MKRIILLISALVLLSGCCSTTNVTGQEGYFSDLQKGDLIRITRDCYFIDCGGTPFLQPTNMELSELNIDHVKGIIPAGTKIEYIGAFYKECIAAPKVLSEYGRIKNGKFKDRKISIFKPSSGELESDRIK